MVLDVSWEEVSSSPAGSDERVSEDRDPVRVVFDEWRSRQARPGSCKLTDSRRRLLVSALREYKAPDLVLLVRYAYESDEPAPRFWRGENASGRTYLDLENLLRKGKLPGRVELAQGWDETGDTGPAEEGHVDLIRALANRSPGQSVEVERPALQQVRTSRPVRVRGKRWGDD